MSKNKRDIDKDIMYSKIMPSAVRNDSGQIQRTGSAMDVSAQKIMSSGAEIPQTDLYPKKSIVVPTPRTKVLVNVAEYAIKEKLDDALSKFNCCKCDKCKMDVIAITLNSVPSKYIVIEEEEITKNMLIYQGSVVPAIIKAIIEVKNHPRH